MVPASRLLRGIVSPHAAIGALAGAWIGVLSPTLGPIEPPVAHADGLADRKGTDDARAPIPLLGTLVQTHSEERVLLDDVSPDADRFASLLMDRTTHESHPMDPRLLAMLRTLAARHGGDVRIELVSGYRSPKLNERLRKKGHHVASHSQHSLGHAVDFRLVEATMAAERAPPSDHSAALDPRAVEAELRSLGWDGGVGSYRTKDDWFVHMDTGPHRRWDGY